MAWKLREVISGGLQNDSAFVRKAQGIMGKFSPDSRLHLDTAGLNTMRNDVAKYGETLLAYAEKKGGAAVLSGNAAEALRAAERHGLKAGKVGKMLEGGLADVFYRLNRNTGYLAQIVAWAGTMLCLGWLVPKLQYAITRKLTGKDVNPGIASAENAQGIHQNAGERPAAVMAGLPVQSSLNRNNFQAFKRHA
jgi:hypothetical protein